MKMNRKNTILLTLSCIFVLVEMHLCNLIQTTSPPNAIQYLSVILACLFCILFAEKTKSYAFTQLALVFTVFADFFLVYLERPNKLFAMICFSVTQIAYFLRIYFEEENKTLKKVHLILRVALSLIILIATSFVLGENTDALALVSMFYYVNLMLNIAFSFFNFKKSWIFTLGLICFILCDTFIGLASLGAYVDLSNNQFLLKLLNPGFNVAWAFYVPSQTLLAISLLPDKIKKRV